MEGSKLIQKLKGTLFNRKGAKFSFSQAAEDIVLSRIFMTKKEGTYVDVGAYHPYKLSNTYLFYLQGWKGVNIEPRPGSKKIFDEYRPLDKNYEVGVSQFEGERMYAEFDISTKNRLLLDNDKTAGKSLISVHTRPLSSILFECNIEHVDFLTIDTEGSELDVLMSIDWDKTSIDILLIEELHTNSSKEKISLYLDDKGYKEHYRLPVNQEADSVFYRKK